MIDPDRSFAGSDCAKKGICEFFTFPTDNGLMLEVMPGSLFAHAVQWIAALLTGSVATAIAVIAIAAIGLAFLQGRIDARRACRTVLGCFIIFGAPSIAAALGALTEGEMAPAARYPSVAEPGIRPVLSVPAPAPYDPYAGASVPVR